jgi:5-hydroxyisourate hydrolase
VATLSTHVLDTGSGRPATGVAVRLSSAAEPLAEATTDADGRVSRLGGDLAPGDYVLRFATGDWFAAAGRDSFYPEIVVSFTIGDDDHYHVPVLLGPFGYTTYRGS